MPSPPPPAPRRPSSSLRLRAAGRGAGLALVLAACDGGAPADCARVEAGPARDACLQARAAALVEQDPAGALAAARAVEDPLARELVLLEVATSGALPEAEVRAVCGAELQSAAVRDRCTSWLLRPHLRVEAGGGGATGPGAAARAAASGGDCASATGERADWCQYEAALAATSPDAARRAVQAISSPDLRGQAAAGVLRQARPRAVAEVDALAGLVPLAEGRWRAESASLLASELPFHVLRACVTDPARRQGCEALLWEELLPRGVAGCAEAGALQEQCFDHLCAGVTEHALVPALDRPAAALAAAVEQAHGRAVAVEAAIGVRPQCHRVWTGRKLAQLADGQAPGRTLADATRRCDGFGDGAAACRGGLAEEHLVRWLAAHPVSGAEALARRALDGDPLLVEGAPDLASDLPCGALAVLTGQLAPGHDAADLTPATRARLEAAAAASGCPWP